MKTETYRCLLGLRHRFGPCVFGKICQKLLALAFQDAGYCVTERGVQGVDIDAARGPERYTAEIKTTQTDRIVLQNKDVVGLAVRSQDGYRPVLGALRLGPLADWLLADAGQLSTGTFPIDCLRAYRLSSLENELAPLFEEVVEKTNALAVAGGQAHLDQLIRSHRGS